jgi:acyl-CoA reductase-like NAD-dependent aldehyde dehydrogenase
MNRVLANIEAGTRRLLPSAVACGETGGYIEPTVFDGVKNSMKIAQEEIGPVLSTITFMTRRKR